MWINKDITNNTIPHYLFVFFIICIISFFFSSKLVTSISYSYLSTYVPLHNSSLWKIDSCIVKKSRKSIHKFKTKKIDNLNWLCFLLWNVTKYIYLCYSMPITIPFSRCSTTLTTYTCMCVFKLKCKTISMQLRAEKCT